MHIRDWFVVRTTRFSIESQLPELRRDERFKLALEMATPSLAARIDDSRNDDAELSLWRYSVRARLRPTPFALFAGTTLGAFAREAALVLPPHDAWRVRVEPGRSSLVASALECVADANGRLDHRVRVNPLALSFGGEWFVPQRGDNRGKKWTETAIERSDAIDAVLDIVGPSSVRLSVLSEELARRLDVEEDDAKDFVRGLLERELLVADALPHAATSERERRSGAVHGEPYAALFRACERVSDKAEHTLTREDYAAVREARSAIEEPSARALYIATHAEASAIRLPHTVRHEAQRFVDAVRHMPLFRSTRLAAFRAAFAKRYEQRWVPLLEAVHDHAGVGLPPTTDNDWDTDTRHYRDVLDLCVFEADRTGAHVDVTPVIDELMRTKPARGSSSSFVVLAELSTASVTDLEAGRFQLVEPRAFGPSAAFPLGRFAHTSEMLLAKLRELADDEQRARPEVEFVDVLTTPLGEAANPHVHPMLRRRVLEASGAAPDVASAISVRDVDVTVRGDEVWLRSRVDGTRIVPRFASAIAPTNPAWHRAEDFLYLVANDGTPGNGTLSIPGLSDRIHVPRVVYGKCVLRPERWMLPPSVWKRSRKSPLTSEAVKRMLERLAIPGVVEWSIRDQRLRLDWQNDPYALAEMTRLANLETAMTLREVLPTNVLRSGDGTHVAEVMFVAGPRNDAEQANVAPPTFAPNEPPVDLRTRTLTPYGHCTYIKIYVDERASRHVARALGEAIRKHGRRLGVRHWHYLYFADPDGHIRLRVFRDKAGSDAVMRVLSKVLAPHLESGRVWNVELATYQREVERYGGLLGIEFAERVFHADSEFACGTATEILSTDDWRVAFAAAAVGRMLDDFGLSIHEQIAWLKERVRGYVTEMKLGEPFRDEVAKLREKHGTRLRELLVANAESEPLVLALAQRSESLTAIARDLRESELAPRRDELLGSYTHLGCARVFYGDLRFHEAHALELLRRERDTELHRQAKS